MPFKYFAGAIFTTQEVVIFCLVAFVIIGMLASSVVFFSKKLLDKKRKGIAKSKLSPGTALLIGFGLVATAIILFFVMPTVIKDSSWNRKQQSCARQAGYESPADDNSGHATAESQSAYHECLNL